MKRGFTLIELIMIIVILGILGAVAVPKYFDLQVQAKLNAEKGVVGGVRAGIYTYYANKIATGTAPASAYPTVLDAVAASGACATLTPCFNIVLDQGAITADWSKGVSTVKYVGPTLTTYTYDPATGNFTSP